MYAALFARRALAEALAETDEPYEPLPTNNELIVVTLALPSFVSSSFNLLSSPIVMPISARSPEFFFVPLTISRVLPNILVEFNLPDDSTNEL